MLPSWHEPKVQTPQQLNPLQEGVILIMFMRPEIDIQGLFLASLNDIQDENYWKNEDIPNAYDPLDASSLYSGLVQSMAIYNSICDFVTECVMNSPELQVAIQQSVDNAVAQAIAQAGLPVPNPSANLLTGSCNKDVLFGQAMYLVDYLHLTQVDILERVEVLSNRIEIAEMLSSLFPPTNFLGADELAQYIDNLLSFIAENYNAEYTVGYQEELACEIFCIMQEDCSLSVEQLFVLFQNRLNGQLEIFNLMKEIFQFVLSGSWQGREIVDGFMFLHMGFLKLLNTLPVFNFFGLGTKLISQRLAIGALSPNSAWDLICTDCPQGEWEHTFDFTASSSGFVLWSSGGSTGGTWSSGNGWVATINTGARRLYLDRTMPNNTELFSYSALYNHTAGNQIAQGNYVSLVASTVVSQEYSRILNGMSVNWSFALSGKGNRLRLHLIDTPSSSSIVLRSITLRGYGSNPFV